MADNILWFSETYFHERFYNFYPTLAVNDCRMFPIEFLTINSVAATDTRTHLPPAVAFFSAADALSLRFFRRDNRSPSLLASLGSGSGCRLLVVWEVCSSVVDKWELRFNWVAAIDTHRRHSSLQLASVSSRSRLGRGRRTGEWSVRLWWTN